MSKKDFETDGTRNGQTIHCPVGDFTCPYCDEDNVCHIADPLEECDSFGSYYASWGAYESDDPWDIDSWDDDVDETGFNPYEGGYDYDC